MHLDNITIKNFGVFRGKHVFDLAPTYTLDGNRRSLTIVSGQNGVGKSTCFQALPLALHGSIALGDRVSRQAYNEFILSRLHRHTEAGALVISDEASVTLSFHYVQSGHRSNISVERTWQRSGQQISERLVVLLDGNAPDTNGSDYQSWLNELVPPGLVSVCFFDAEKLDALSNPEQHDNVLGEVLRRLLGLDLVDRLHTDLEQYTFSQTGGRKSISTLRTKVKKYQISVDVLDKRLKELHTEADVLIKRQAKIEAELERQLQRLASKGGVYSGSRPVLERRRTELQEEIRKVSGEIHELCGGLLPFALVPKLCQSLSLTLTREAEQRRYQAADLLWRERLATVDEILQKDKIWDGFRISRQNRKVLAKRIAKELRAIQPSNPKNKQVFIHDLANPEQEQLQNWITQVLYTIPQDVNVLTDHLKEFQAEESQIEATLQQLTDKNILGPLLTKVEQLKKELADVQKQHGKLSEQIGALQFQRQEQERNRQNTAEQLHKARGHELAERSKSVLRIYKDALIRERLTTLESALVISFNTICRKEHLLKSVHIDPHNFNVQLRGADGQALTLDSFSAGERQLYALSLLWALRKIGEHQIPLVIDTPLARLDETHRERLIHEYIPKVSDQVLIFTTDTELDSGLLAQAEPYVARVYRLNYDMQRDETISFQNIYSNNRNVTLTNISRRN